MMLTVLHSRHSFARARIATPSLPACPNTRGGCHVGSDRHSRKRARKSSSPRYCKVTALERVVGVVHRREGCGLVHVVF